MRMIKNGEDIFSQSAELDAVESIVGDGDLDTTATDLTGAVNELNSSKLGTTVTRLTSLEGSSTETTLTLQSAMSNFNWLLFVLDTGGNTGTFSDLALIPRKMYNPSLRTVVVLTYPVSNTHVNAKVTYVSDTKVKIKMSDTTRGVFMYGIN